MKEKEDLLTSLERFADVRVLVLGDVMLDTYWSGTTTRISPEAPVPIVNLQEIRDVPGGAANVAANIQALGAKAILVGAIGDDASGRRLCAELARSGTSPDNLVVSPARPTTSKIRVLVGKQQLVRVDEEVRVQLSGCDEDRVVACAAERVAEADVVVLSDYAKGCLTSGVTNSVIKASRQAGKPVIVDPKSRDFRRYDGSTILTPNMGEAMLAAHMEFTGEKSVDVAADTLLSSTEIDSLLITLGEHGMKLYSRESSPIHFNSSAREVFDVTGAGDTVVAALSVGLGAGLSKPKAARTANIAAGLAVEKVGTSTVSLGEIRAAIEAMN